MWKWLLAVLLASTAAMADSPTAGEAGMPPPKMQERFNQHKLLELEGHRTRIQILQEAAACIQAATNPQAFRACERHEREASAAYQNQHRVKMDALRGEYRQLREPMQGPGRVPAEGQSPKP